MEAIIRKIRVRVEPVYRGSTIYTKTIWRHAQFVAKFAREFAVGIGASSFISEAGGLLHDVGAAMYGREDHHITGAKEASHILLECGCPLELVGPIEHTVYAHRGSQRIAFLIPEARCVAAADSKDHFQGVEELWNVQTRDLGMTALEAHKRVSEELENDWEKISPEIKALLNGEYEEAKQELLRISSRNGNHKNPRVKIGR